MTGRAEAASAEALRAARLCAIDPGLGGIILSGDDDSARDVIALLTAALPEGARARRLPVDPREDQLDGGIDWAAALAGRTGEWRAGVLDGSGLLIVPMAERLQPAVAARLAGAVDRGLLVLALAEPGAMPPAALADRLAFRPGPPGEPIDDEAPVDPAAAATALAATAHALGIASPRADRLALRAARALALAGGRHALAEGDVAEAVRLVLLPRATRLPAPAEPEQPPADAAPPPDGGEGEGMGELGDRVLDAARAAIDPDLLAAFLSGNGRGDAARSRGAGERRRSRARGRPSGSRLGDPRAGGRLALIETLRAAAPWQRLRGRTDRVLVRRDDLRIQKREARAETAVIFAVDASGSAAMARLAEAKGAVELLLGQVYVQRAEVALTAFRGAGAELLLPPTRSLTRARRALAELPGGGGTPLADGIGAAAAAACAVRARGRTPLVVLLSDGRANLASGGIAAGRQAAERDALAAGRALRAERISAVFVDTGARPRPEGATLAEAMGARYLPLPFAGAEGLKSVIDAFAPRVR